MDMETVIMAVGFSLVIGACIFLIIILATSGKNRSGKHYPRRPSILLFYLLFFLISVGVVLFFIMVIALFPPIGVFSVLLFVLLIGMIIHYSVTSREYLTLQVFSTIGASIRQNLPLPTAMESEARCQTGRAMLTFQRIAGWLTQGFSLSESLRRGYPRCPGYAVAMVGAAERIQQVPQAVAGIENHLTDKARQGGKVLPVSPVYPIAVIMIAIFVFTGLMIFVVPKFATIFADMGHPLPGSTQALIDAAGLMGNEGYSIAVLVIIFVVIPGGIYLKFRPRRPNKPYLLSRIGDHLKWRLPFLIWFERSYSLLQVVPFLRLGLAAGTTLDKVIAGAAELDVNACYRLRMNNWLQRVHEGENISDAARKSGVGRQLAWAFDQNVNPGNTPAILESLESFYRTNYSFAANLARYIFWPCTTILLAAMVGFIVYAMFAPIVGMLEFTVQSTMP